VRNASADLKGIEGQFYQSLRDLDLIWKQEMPRARKVYLFESSFMSDLTHGTEI
jgi:hypothetical protein